MRDRVILRLMAEALVGFDEWESDRIMDFSADPAFLHLLLDRVAIVHLHNVKVKDVCGLRWHFGQLKA